MTTNAFASANYRKNGISRLWHGRSNSWMTGREPRSKRCQRLFGQGFERIANLIQANGLERVREPYVKHLEGARNIWLRR
jgi:hypothetical protein